MKKLILLFLLLIIGGCAEVDYSDIHKAQCFCEDKGGIQKIDYELMFTYIECRDGTKKEIGKINCSWKGE